MIGAHLATAYDAAGSDVGWGISVGGYGDVGALKMLVVGEIG